MADQGNGTYIWDVDEQTWKNLGNVIGVQGPKGDIGPEGPQGPAGADGATGATGAIGPQGPAGPQGEPGPTGPEGPQGPAGSIGPQGPQGVQGPIGPAGEAGPQGVQGNIGPTGPVGPKGDKGDQGEPGIQGPQGIEGPQGNPGANGIDGSKIVQYYDSGLSLNTFTEGYALKQYILPNTAKTGDLILSYKYKCYAILGEETSIYSKGPAYSIDTSTIGYLPLGPQGPAGYALKANEVILVPRVTDPLPGFYAYFFTGFSFDDPNRSKNIGDFVYWDMNNVTYFGRIDGFDTYNGESNVPYCDVINATALRGSEGTPGRSVYHTNCSFTQTGDVCNLADIPSEITPRAYDVIFNNTNEYIGTIVNIDDELGTFDVIAVTQPAQGPQGIRGIQGPKGDKGDTGERGLQGQRGIQGPKGDTGSVGPAGKDGSRIWIAIGDIVQYPEDDNPKILISNLQAVSGYTPNIGDQVISAGSVTRNLYEIIGREDNYMILKLLAPITGAPGRNGADGATGPQGPQGPAGPQGEPGIQGPKGDKGDNGTTIKTYSVPQGTGRNEFYNWLQNHTNSWGYVYDSYTASAYITMGGVVFGVVFDKLNITILSDNVSLWGIIYYYD